VLCSAHNRLSAEEVFGRDHIETSIELRRRKRVGTAAGADEDDETYDKLLKALTGLGFRSKPTRLTLDAMRRGQGSVVWTAPLEALLREAIHKLTA
jgi:hypothetical protein